MKKTNALATVASIVLFLAMAAYLGVYIWRGTRERVQTSPAVLTTVTDSGSASGIIVRRELVLSADRAFVYVDAEEGAWVSGGSVIARATDSEEDLAQAGRMRELQNEISHMRTLLSDTATAASMTERTAAVRAAVGELSECVATGDLSSLDAACVSLSSLVFAGDASAVSSSDLSALEAELRELQNTAFQSAKDVSAPDSGLFTTIVDGYEALTPEALTSITPSGITALLESRGEVGDNVIGKLITGFRWYCACVMDESAAAKLTLGSYTSLSLGRRYGGEMTARVDYISPAEGKQCAVVFSCLTSMGETLASRAIDAQVIFSESTGLRVPVKALHVNAAGETFCYVLTASQVEKKTVEILAKTDDYYLVERENTADALREGNEIIVGGKAVTEGMYIE